MSEPQWIRVTKEKPCPACGEPDWCAWAPDGNLKCERSTEPPTGMRRLDICDGGAIFKYADLSSTSHGTKRPTRISPKPIKSNEAAHQQLEEIHVRAIADAKREAIEALARDLGVTVASLRSLGIGWISRATISQLRASGNGWNHADLTGAWEFPERDGSGRIVGFSLRAANGKKGSPSGKAGCRRGLIIPNDLADLPDPVLVVEGATDVAACVTQGIAAVGRPSNASGADMLAELLAHRDVLVVGENDLKDTGKWPGREGAIAVATSLAASWRKTVAWSLPPGPAKDIREVLRTCREMGLDMNCAVQTRKAGEVLVSELKNRQSTVGAPSGDSKSEVRAWSSGDVVPEPLPDLLPPVLSFVYGMLPEQFRPWIEDIANRIQCPPDFPAVSAIVGLASIVGRKIGIRPKQFDDWLVVPNLWGAVIGRPGVMKTPALAEPLRPLKALEAAAKKAHDEQVVELEAAKLVADVRKKGVVKSIQKAMSDQNQAMRIARESVAMDADIPHRRRYITNDATVEKLGEILNENPTGILTARDELTGFLRSLDKDGQEGSRAFYLESWNGTGSYVYDRIGRGTLDIPAAISSILGGIQPGPLAAYLAQATRQGAGDDGLMQRFQLLVWPDLSKEWVNVDRAPDREARKRAHAVFDRMNTLDPLAIGASVDQDDHQGIPYLHFDDAAQVEFNKWREGLEPRLRGESLHPAMESHLSKYRSLVPSLALLFHLADGTGGPVGLVSLNRALAWAEYLESHAHRVYAQVSRSGLAAARALGKKILEREITSGFALRDVYRHGWSCLSTAEDVKQAAEILVDHDWLEAQQVTTAGRTGTVYVVNPNVFKRFDRDLGQLPDAHPCGTDGTDGRGQAGPSGGSVSPSGGGAA